MTIKVKDETSQIDDDYYFHSWLMNISINRFTNSEIDGELIHSIICLKALQADLKKDVRNRNNCFDDHELFGDFFNKVHIRFQRFLSSYGISDPSQIDLDILDFSKFTKKK